MDISKIALVSESVHLLNAVPMLWCEFWWKLWGV